MAAPAMPASRAASAAVTAFFDEATNTVAEERAHNIHVRDGVAEDESVALRTARDATLGMPKLIIPSIQVNMKAGELPEPEENGVRYLRVPLNSF